MPTAAPAARRPRGCGPARPLDRPLAGARDSEAATAVALLVSVVVFATVAGATWRVGWSAAPYVAGPAALELAYFAWRPRTAAPR